MRTKFFGCFFNQNVRKIGIIPHLLPSFSLLTFLLITLVLSIVSVPLPAEADSHAKGGTLIFGRGGDSIGLDPALEEDGESFKVCDNIYDTLVQYKEGSTELEPGLATSWESSEDGLIWDFFPSERCNLP